MPKTSTKTETSFRIKLAVAFAFLIGSAIIPLRCVSLGPSVNSSNSNANMCSGTCSGKKEIDVEGYTLLLTALSARNQMSGIQCTGGNLACGVSTNTNSSEDCCRITELIVDPFSFVVEGADQCSGGGSNTYNGSSQACTSFSGGVESAVTNFVSSLPSTPCRAVGKTDCGYEVSGKGKIRVRECADKCEVLSTEIQYQIVCKATDVEGFLDEYKIKLTTQIKQQCEEPTTPT